MKTLLPPQQILGNYYWDGDNSNNWATHDPCRNNTPSHKQDAVDPWGAIFLRGTTAELL